MNKTTGKIGAVSDYNDKDYFNVALGDPDNGNWFIGNDSTDVEKGDRVEIRYENDNQITEINVIEEDNEGGQNTADSDAGNGGGSDSGSKTSSNMSPRQAGITANSAVKMAAEHTNKDYDDNPKEYIDEVNEMSKAFNNMIKDRLGENL